MIIQEVGGASPLDTTTLGHKVRVPEEWFDSVTTQRDVVTPPGSYVSYDLAQGTFIAEPRTVIIQGFIESTDGTMTTLEADIETIKTKLNLDSLPAADVEIVFNEQNGDVIGVGHCLKVQERPTEKGGFVVPVRGFIITFEMLDPRRYDISGGRPGTALL